MATLKDLNWTSDNELIFINPKLPSAIRERIEKIKKPRLPGHIWVASSGTTTSDEIKLYALSFEAFLLSARSVNAHFGIRKEDTWLNPLPLHHVGGISIYARASLTKSHVIDISEHSWQPEFFLDRVHAESVTLTSLVPTQIYDLVELNTVCPPSLRVVVVGGGRLEEQLYQRARRLNYPILPSYGMTEICSQIATAELASLDDDHLPRLRVLPHVAVEKAEDGRIVVKSKALFTLCLKVCSNGKVVEERPVDGSYRGEDLVRTDGPYLEVLGRSDELVKVSGELVSLASLQSCITEVCGGNKAFLFAVPDERKGSRVCAVFEINDFKRSSDWVSKFNNLVLPVSRIDSAYYLAHLPRTDLGKFKSGEIKKNLGLF